jgi:hypothetical protein
LFAGGIVLFVLVGGWFLDWYIEPRTSGQKKDLVQALGLLTAGVAGAVGIFFTWRGQRITQESLQDTRENSVENLRLAREGQITERFTRAKDQLGATDDKQTPRLEIRLGGIYALERIAWDSPERDHSTVMAVLTAYVRENSVRTPPPPFDPHRPTADIQAILDVLRRAQARVSEKYRAPRLDLRGANLRGANLLRADLQRANLQGANLQEANLLRADLQRANLQGANLLYAKVTDEQLANTRSLQGATMPDGSQHP